MADELANALFTRNESEHQSVSTSRRSRPLGIAARAAELRRDKRKAGEREQDRDASAALEASSAYKKAKNRLTLHADTRQDLFESSGGDDMQDDSTPEQGRSGQSGGLSLSCRDREAKGTQAEVPSLSPFGDLDENLLALIAESLMPRSSVPERLALPDIEAMGKVNTHWNAVLNEVIGSPTIALELAPQRTETDQDGKSVTAAKSRLQLARELHVESQRKRILSGSKAQMLEPLEELYSGVEWHRSMLAQESAAMRVLSGPLFRLAPIMLASLCSKGLKVIDTEMLEHHCAALLASERSDKYSILFNLFEHNRVRITTDFIDRHFVARFPLFGDALVGHSEKSLMARLYLRGSEHMTAGLIDRHAAQLLALSPESDVESFRFRLTLMTSLFQIRCNGIQFAGAPAHSAANFIVQQRAAILERSELQLPRALKNELLKELYEAAESRLNPDSVITECAVINADACLSEMDKRELVKQLRDG